MSGPEKELEDLVQALRANLPDTCQRERTRKRLIKAGLLASAGGSSSQTVAATAKALSANQTLSTASTTAVTGATPASSGAAASSLAGATKATLSTGAVGTAKLGLAAKLAGLPLAAKAGSAAVLLATSATLTLEFGPARNETNTGRVDSTITTHGPVSGPASRIVRRPDQTTIHNTPLATADDPTEPVVTPQEASDEEEPRPTVQAPLARTTPSAKPGAQAKRTKPGRPSIAGTVRKGGTAGGKGYETAFSHGPVRSSELAMEAALLERALSALLQHELTRAEGLLTEHERRYPAGLLARERRQAQHRLHILQNKPK